MIVETPNSTNFLPCPYFQLGLHLVTGHPPALFFSFGSFHIEMEPGQWGNKTEDFSLGSTSVIQHWFPLSMEDNEDWLIPLWTLLWVPGRFLCWVAPTAAPLSHTESNSWHPWASTSFYEDPLAPGRSSVEQDALIQWPQGTTSTASSIYCHWELHTLGLPQWKGSNFTNVVSVL